MVHTPHDALFQASAAVPSAPSKSMFRAAEMVAEALW
jgi:hypothetical protein